jgi:hypothetical protein
VGFDYLLPTVRKVTPHQPQAALTAVEKVSQYVQIIIPAVYISDLPLSVRLWRELLQHHTVLSLLHLQSARKRSLGIFKILTILTFMLFLTAVFFDVSNPGDDGACARFEEQEECLHRKSPFDSSRSFCSWNTVNSTCAYNDESISFTALFYLTVLTTILTSIASVPLDYCFHILAAPTLYSQNVSKVADSVKAIVHGARRISLLAVNPQGPDSNNGLPAPNELQKASSRSRSVVHRSVSFLSRKSMVSSQSTACRQLGEDFERLAEAARRELPIISAMARSSIARRDSLRDERKASIRQAGANSGSRRVESRQPVSSGAMTGTDIFSAEISPFLDDILLQRSHMNDDEEATRLYEDQWGVRKVPDSDRDFALLPTSASTVAAELESVYLEAQDVIESLPSYSVHHAGLEILHLFMVDLLGRNTAAAKIFKEKFGEEFSDSRVVFVIQKYSAAVLLIGLNAFFVYFVLLKGLQKGQAWQLQYLVCSMIQVMMDVLVFETTECVWLNVVVPGSVQTDVIAAAALLKATAEDTVCPRSTPPSKFFLNAPAHLFVSARVAKAYPQFLESLIVQNYSSHLPGQVSRTWAHCQSSNKDYDSAATSSPFLGIFSALRIGVAVQAVLAFPFLYQRILLRFAQPVVFSAVSVMWFSTIRSPSSMAALGVAFGVCVVFYLWRRRAQQLIDRQRSILPVAEEPQADSTASPGETRPECTDNLNGLASALCAMPRLPNGTAVRYDKLIVQGARHSSGSSEDASNVSTPSYWSQDSNEYSPSENFEGSEETNRNACPPSASDSDAERERCSMENPVASCTNSGSNMSSSVFLSEESDPSWSDAGTDRDEP